MQQNQCEMNKNILVSVHVDGSRSNDLKEKKGPICRPLGASLHCVKHSSHLAHKKYNEKICTVLQRKDHPHHCMQPNFDWFKNFFKRCSSLWIILSSLSPSYIFATLFGSIRTGTGRSKKKKKRKGYSSVDMSST